MKKSIKNSCNAISYLTISIIVLIIFFTIGSYLSVLSFAFLGLTLSLLTFFDLDKRIAGTVFAPFFLLCMYRDIFYGKIIDGYSNIFISISLMILVIFFLQKRIMLLIQKLFKNRCFVLCPNCFHSDINLVDKCIKCGFNSLIFEISYIVNDRIAIPSNDEIINKVLKNEMAIFSKKIPMFDFFTYINDKYIRVTNFLVTSRKIIFLEFCPFDYIGWKNIYLIDYSKLESIKIFIKKITSSNRFFIEFAMKNGDIYQINFRFNGKNRIFISEITPHLGKISANFNIKFKSFI